MDGMTKERALLKRYVKLDTGLRDGKYGGKTEEYLEETRQWWEDVHALLAEPEGEDAIWDATLMDGLRDEPPFPAPLSCAEAERVCARTPPDFDAALGELECDQMNLDRCHDEWNKALVANDEAEAQLCEASVKIATSLRDASRQRVRELYEAVVRERDAARDAHDKVLDDLEPQLAALRAALTQGREG